MLLFSPYMLGEKEDNYYGETFVVSNEKVDSHIHKVYQGSKQKVSVVSFANVSVKSNPSITIDADVFHFSYFHWICYMRC